MSRQTSTAWRKLNAEHLDGETLCVAGCGRVATTGDHVTPVARGGEDTEDNYAPMCASCNSRKGTGPMPRQSYLAPQWFKSS